MARTIGSIIGIRTQTEMVLMTLMALWTNMFDMAIFELNTNLDQVWTSQMDPKIFPEFTQHVVRMILSTVVLIRTFSLHVYIAFLIVMLWPLLCENRPTLMLPWLGVSFVKNLATGVLTLGTGLFTCMLYGTLRPACVKFIISHTIELAPSFYMWFVGLSYYRDLKQPKEIDKTILKENEDLDINLAIRRRKVKSMTDENILRNQLEARRKYIGSSALVVDDLFKNSAWDYMSKRISRSLDSMLDTLAAEAEYLELEDYESIDENLTIPEKTAKLLGLTKSDISKIVHDTVTINELPLYPVTHQKKCTLLSYKNIDSLFNSSKLNTQLLAGTSFYTSSVKPLRISKSEQKCPKDVFSLKTPDFIESLSEHEVETRTLNEDSELLNTEIEADDNLLELEESSCDSIENNIDLFQVDEDEKNDSIYARDSVESCSFFNKFTFEVNSKPLLFPELEQIENEDDNEEEKVEDDNEEKVEDNKEEMKIIKEDENNKETVVEEVVYPPVIVRDRRPISPYKIELKLNKTQPNDPSNYDKCFHDSACQASTLSRKILESPPKEIINKSLCGTPTRLPSPRIISPRQKNNSYLEIHKNKLNLEKNIQTMNKFGVLSPKRQVSADGYSQIYDSTHDNMEKKINGANPQTNLYKS